MCTIHEMEGIFRYIIQSILGLHVAVLAAYFGYICIIRHITENDLDLLGKKTSPKMTYSLTPAVTQIVIEIDLPHCLVKVRCGEEVSRPE